MPSTKNFTPSFNSSNFGLWTLANLILSLVGTTFLAINGVKSGTVYLALFVSPMALLVLVTLFRKNEDKPIKELALPFSQRFNVDLFTHAVGFWLPMLLSIGLALTPLSVLQTPLFANDIIEGTQQSFSTATIEGSIQTKIFNIMYVAGTEESYTYSWMAVWIGAILGLLIAKLLGFKKKSSAKKTTVTVVSYGFAIITFISSHMINGSYDSPGKFIFAGIFMFLNIWTIFKIGVPLAFWIGYHQANNLIYLYNVLGGATVTKGFFGVFGLVFISLNLLVAFYLIKNSDKVIKDMKWWWRT